METHGILLGKRKFEDSYSVELYKKDTALVAKIYLTDTKIGECVFKTLGLSPKAWSYETLPDFARLQIDQILNQNKSSKASQIFLKTKNPLPDDSDEELVDLEIQNTLVVFNKKEHIHPLAMTLPSQDQNIKGSTLIEITHKNVKSRYWDIIEVACEYEREIGGALISPPNEEEGILHIQHPKDWFMTLGGWKGMMPREEVKDYFFYQFFPQKAGKKFTGVQIYQEDLTFPISDHRIFLPEKFSINQVDVTKNWIKQQNEWVEVPSGKNDLSYSQIARAIETIKKAFRVDDSQIASLQLYALSREMEIPIWFKENIPEKNQKEILHFLDYLNGLMFGIEASGLNAALATGLMVLDLIADNRLDYMTAFKANPDGGYYPYACLGNNRGTYQAREEILLHNKQACEPYSMKVFREDTSLSPVATKEAILIKEWLQFNKVVQADTAYSEKIEAINRAIEDLIAYYYFPWLNREYSLVKFSKN